MTPFSFAGLLTGISSVGFGLFVLLMSQNRKIGRIWFLFTLSVAGWGFGALWIGYTKSAAEGLLAWRIAYALGVIWIAPFFYHFVCIFLELRRNRSIFLHYLIATGFLLTVPTSLFFCRARWVFDSFYYGLSGKLYPFYFAWWIGLVLYSHFELIRTYKMVSPKKKIQIKYFIFAVAAAYGGGCLAYLPNFGIDVYPWGTFAIILYPVINSIAIVKHNLMDIELLARKTLIYSVVSGILTAIYFGILALVARLFESWTGYQTLISSVIAFCIINVMFSPLRNRVQAFVDRHFFRGWTDRETVREVAAGFSHELKSPLSGLSMQAQLMLTELEELERNRGSLREALPKIKEELHYIINKAMDAARRIEAVRGVAEPASGQMEAVQISDALENSLSVLQPLVDRVQADVKRDVPAYLPPVRSNLKQLEIVFGNLIKNAIEAVGQRQAPAIELSARENGDSVIISVKDNGPGISWSDQGKLFEPYFTTKGRRGTGMGLYFSQQIIKAHGGSVEVKSVEGKGTEFIVRLPKYVEQKGLTQRSQ